MKEITGLAMLRRERAIIDRKIRALEARADPRTRRAVLLASLKRRRTA